MTLKGKIIKGIAGFYYVHDGHSRIFECKARGIFRKDGVKPLPGDVVSIDADLDTLKGSIVDIEERKNKLLRPAVSNVDQAVLIFAMRQPEPSFNLIDKLLVYYKLYEIPVKLCFNKTDIDSEENIEKYKNIYRDSGVDIYFISNVSDTGIDLLTGLLKGKTSVITGPSGVGKSTLINKLIPDAMMETGEISEKLRRGKHTTRHSELFCLDEETFIMDTPGFTSFKLVGILPEELWTYYEDFKPYVDGCKFDDCVHLGETVCGVKKALCEGRIDKTRYENYVDIYYRLKNPNDY